MLVNKPSSSRRFELDWLRILAFGLLIPFHTGMFFVSWEWHIKNNVQWKSLEFIMIFFVQWRMSLLFLISGAALAFTSKNRQWKDFIRDRSVRILVPLIFGMLVIIPPQTYLQVKDIAHLNNYWEVYPYAMADGLSELNWNHLWYLAYLFFYSVLLLLVPQTTRLKWATIISKPVVICTFGALASITEFLLRPIFQSTHDLDDDWANHALYIPFFLMGYSLYSNPQSLSFIKKWRWQFFAVSSLIVCFLYVVYWVPDVDPQKNNYFIYQVAKGFNRWGWILTFLGFSLNNLTFSNPFVSYASQAVYPFYILHQTVIILIAYPLTNVSWPVQIKFLCIICGTIAVCLVLYELIRRTHILCLLFGINDKSKFKSS
jgi:hypothetical protein